MNETVKIARHMMPANIINGDCWEIENAAKKAIIVEMMRMMNDRMAVVD
jgi:hypothetical protein